MTPERFRHVLGHVPTGVVVATSIDADGAPAGMSVGSFTSVSLDPPLVAFLPAKTSTSFTQIRAAGAFCVNVLAADQEVVSRAFATSGGDKFAALGWQLSAGGSPVLDGVVAWIDCTVEDVIDAGDHWIVLGRVLDLDVADETLPLVFFRGGYGQFAAASLSAPAEPDLVGHLRVLDKAREAMERIADELGLACLAVARVDEELVVLGRAGTLSHSGATDRIGQRMPFVAPLGCLFVAWAGPAAVAEWLSRLCPGLDMTDAARYRAMVDRVRARGWSISMGSRPQIAFDRVLARWSDAPTEAHRQAVYDAAELVGTANHELADAELTGDDLDVRSVSAPVFGASGDVVLVLTLIGLPKPCDAQALERLRERLLVAAAVTTGELGGRPPRAIAE